MTSGRSFLGLLGTSVLSWYKHYSFLEYQAKNEAFYNRKEISIQIKLTNYNLVWVINIQGANNWLHCRATIPVLDFLFLNILCNKNKILLGLSHSEGILLHGAEWNPSVQGSSQHALNNSFCFITHYFPYLQVSMFYSHHSASNSLLTKQSMLFHMSVFLYILKEMAFPCLGKLLLIKIQLKCTVLTCFFLCEHVNNALFISLA